MKKLDYKIHPVNHNGHDTYYFPMPKGGTIYNFCELFLMDNCHFEIQTACDMIKHFNFIHDETKISAGKFIFIPYPIIEKFNFISKGKPVKEDQVIFNKLTFVKFNIRIPDIDNDDGIKTSISSGLFDTSFSFKDSFTLNGIDEEGKKVILECDPSKICKIDLSMTLNNESSPSVTFYNANGQSVHIKNMGKVDPFEFCKYLKQLIKR